MATIKKIILRRIFGVLKKFGCHRKIMSNYILIFILVVLFWIAMVFFHVNRVLMFSSQCSTFFSKKDILLQKFPKFQPAQDFSSARKSNFVGDSLRKIMEHQDVEYEVLKNKARSIEEHLKFLKTFPLMSDKEKMKIMRIRNVSLTHFNSLKVENTKKYQRGSLNRKHVKKPATRFSKTNFSDGETVLKSIFSKIGSKKSASAGTLQKIPNNPLLLKTNLMIDNQKTKLNLNSGGVVSTGTSIIYAVKESSDGVLPPKSLPETAGWVEETDEDTIAVGLNSTESDYHLESEENEISNLSYWDQEAFRQDDGLLEEQKQMFSRHSFNVAASDALPWNRSMPDTRVASCQQMKYDLSQLPLASVIICFHNEAISALLRTIHSVLHRSPPSLLQEILLVDDNSTLDELGAPLEQQLEQLAKVRLMRTHQREGLIRARLLGSRAALGEVLVFLDSHCECNQGWLEPLLHSARADPHKIICPEIDTIKFDTFEYVRSPRKLHGSFTWKLQFMWKGVPQYIQNTMVSEADTFRSPAMIGGLFAINKKYFFELGGYDENLDIWGGENLELSFRVWMCGGSIEIHPCSRVGHVFRHIIPYEFPDGGLATIQRNLARVAEVWMDEYKYFYYAAQGVSPDEIEVGDVQSRRQLRQRLQCQSFSWYLDHIIPEIPIPSLHMMYFGEIRSNKALLCLMVENQNGTRTLGLNGCHGYAKNQHFYITKEGRFHHSDLCVTMTDNSTISLAPCSTDMWAVQGLYIQHVGSELCLTAVDNEAVTLDPCVPGDTAQQWTPSYHFDWTKLKI